VLLGQHVAELRQRAAQVGLRVGRFEPVVQVHLDLAEPFRLQAGESFEQRPVVLLGRVEIGVAEGRAVVVAHGRAGGARRPAPLVEAAPLLVEREEAAALAPRRLEVVGDDDDEVGGAAALAEPPRQLARAPERVARQPRQRPREFGEKARILISHFSKAVKSGEG